MSITVNKVYKSIEENVTAAEDESVNSRRFNKFRIQLDYLTEKKTNSCSGRTKKLKKPLNKLR